MIGICETAVDRLMESIYIHAPPNSGSLYFNYKKSFSIILLAVCNNKYEFILFDVGAFGCESVGGILTRSELGKAMRQNRLNLPIGNSELQGTNIKVPYYFVGDEAYEMTPHLMRPDPGRHLEQKQMIFNYRLSRARRLIENSFGILVSRWRFLLKAVGIHPGSVSKFVLEAICLPNFLMNSTNERRKLYCPAGSVDEENGDDQNGDWRQEIDNENLIQDFNNINFQEEVVNAHVIRNTPADYFLTPEGEVPWQYE